MITLINWRDFMNLITYLKGINYNIIEKGKDYSGKKLFSKIIPDKINIKHKKTEIKDGDLIKGFVKKQFLTI